MDTEHNSNSTDNMPGRSEADFIAQAKLAQDALEQFTGVLNDPKYATANLMKAGAMEDVVEKTVCTLYFIPATLLSETLF
jgi:hypothetical protein